MRAAHRRPLIHFPRRLPDHRLPPIITSHHCCCYAYAPRAEQRHEQRFNTSSSLLRFFFRVAYAAACFSALVAVYMLCYKSCPYAMLRHCHAAALDFATHARAMLRYAFGDIYAAAAIS